MTPAFVFIVLATGYSDRGVSTRVMGVFAHMHQTTSLVRQIKANGQQALVIKHEVTDPPPARTATPSACHGPGWHDGSCTHQLSLEEGSR